MMFWVLAFMVVGTIFWGSNLGWQQCLTFWAAFLLGGLLFLFAFHSPRLATVYMGIVGAWFVGKAATNDTSML